MGALAGCAAAPPRPDAQCLPWRASGAALELVVLGSGGPRSFGRASSGYAVLVAGVPRLLIDAGPGAAVRLGALGLELESLEHVFLTHLHIDHAGDVPGVVKQRDLSFSHPLDFHFHGPAGGGDYPSTSQLVEGLLGPAGVFRYLRDFRNPLTLTVTDLPVVRGAPPRVVLEEAGLRVLAVAVDHADVPALAFRVEAGGQALVVSGDLASTDDALVGLARDAGLLVYDAAVLAPPASPPVLSTLHTAPARIGEVAAQARVGRLLLSHLTPSVEGARGEVLEGVAAHYRGPVEFAEDCLGISLPR